MIELAQGDLLEANVEALVNAVNTVGVMGAGIALQFRQKYPAMFQDYKKACNDRSLVIGKVHVFDLQNLAVPPRWIINFPTKRDWREPSRLTDVEAGLGDLASTVRRLSIRSIAIPPLGCGLGALEWSEVRPRIEQAFAEIPDVEVLLFAPNHAVVKN